VAENTVVDVRPLIVVESVRESRLNGFPAVARFAVFTVPAVALTVPREIVALLATGSAIPQRGSGMEVTWMLVPSGSAYDLDNCPVCDAALEVEMSPVGRVFVCCSEKGAVGVMAHGMVTEL
jgi:hypothetical protein